MCTLNIQFTTEKNETNKQKISRKIQTLDIYEACCHLHGKNSIGLVNTYRFQGSQLPSCGLRHVTEHYRTFKKKNP